MPPDRGSIAPISANVRPPAQAIRPPASQAASTSDADGSASTIAPVVRKMADPITFPTTSIVAGQKVMPRTSA